MLCRVAVVRADVSEELSASFIRVTTRSVRRLLVTANVPSSLILVTLMKEALDSSETSVLKRATRRNIPEDTIVHDRVYNKQPLILIPSQTAQSLPPTYGCLPSVSFPVWLSHRNPNAWITSVAANPG
jgi:hypothetical protein